MIKIVQVDMTLPVTEGLDYGCWYATRQSVGGSAASEAVTGKLRAGKQFHSLVELWAGEGEGGGERRSGLKIKGFENGPHWTQGVGGNAG